MTLTRAPDAASKDVVIRHRVLLGSLSNYVGRVISLAAWFLLTPFLLAHLGATGYGLWVLAGSLVAYGWLLDLGIQGTIVKYVAEHRALGESEQANRLIATSLWLHSVFGLAAFALCVVVAPVVPDLFNVPPDEHTTTTWLVVLMGAAVAISFPCESGTAVLQGLHRYDLVNVVSALGTLLNVGAIILVIFLGAGLLGVVAVSIPVSLATQALSVWFVHRVAPDVRVGWRGADRRLVRTIVWFSSPLLVGEAAGVLQRKTDELVIAAVLPVSAVTPYALARRLSELCRQLAKQLMRVFLPLASELDAERDTPRLRSLYIAGTRVTLVIFLPIGCTVAILARPIISLWVGAAYADNAQLVAILTLAGLMMTTQWLAVSVLQGMARHRPVAVVSLCSALANLALSVALVRPLGLTGIALGTLIPTTAEYLVVMPYAARVIGVSASDYLRRVLMPALLPAIPMAVVLHTLERAAEPASVPLLLLLVAIGLIVYAGGYLAVSASHTERQLCRGVALSTLRFAEGRLKRS